MKKIRNAYDAFKLFGVAMVIWVVLFIVISVVVGVAGLLLFLFPGGGTAVSCVRQYKLSNYLDGVGPEPLPSSVGPPLAARANSQRCRSSGYSSRL